MQHDFILLDRSGSMLSIWGEVISSINAYVEKLASDNVDTGVTLAGFDTDPKYGKLEFTIVRDRIIPSTWSKVLPTETPPRGMTPLNDAIARIISLANAGNYDKVAIIIVTDGMENASREISQGAAKKLLADCRSKNWQIIFLGADFDNIIQAESLGNNARQTVAVASANLNYALKATAEKRSAYATTGATMDFAEDEKEKLRGKTP